VGPRGSSAYKVGKIEHSLDGASIKIWTFLGDSKERPPGGARVCLARVPAHEMYLRSVGCWLALKCSYSFVMCATRRVMCVRSWCALLAAKSKARPFSVYPELNRIRSEALLAPC